MEYEFIGHSGSNTHKKIVGMIFYKVAPRNTSNPYVYESKKSIYLQFMVRRGGSKGMPPITKIEFFILDAFELRSTIAAMNKNYRPMSTEKFQKMHSNSHKLLEQQILIRMLSER